MAGYQYTVIIGNVGRDPELRYTPSGVAVCDFSVAVTRRWNDRQSNERREETTWFRVTCWRQLAEIANQYVVKGRQVMVAGRVSTSAYIGQDGEARASLELTALDMQLLGRRDEVYDTGSEDEEYPSEPEDLPF
jgi:single-strand DNA-binding protein